MVRGLLEGRTRLEAASIGGPVDARSFADSACDLDVRLSG
jgi:hypothetical protein